MTRTDELTAKLIDGTLTEAEGQELDALLAADSAAAADHLAVLELEAALRGGRTNLDLAGPTLDRIQKAQADRTTAAVMAEITTRPAPIWAPRRAAARPRRRVLVAGTFLALAAGLLLGIWLGHPVAVGPASPGPGSPGESPAYAHVTSVTGAVELLTPGGETLAAEAGRPLTPGETLRTLGDDGHAVVEFPDQTRFEIEPGTTVRLALPEAGGPPTGRLFLATGQLITTIPERADAQRHPVVVRTSAAEVFARTGKFVLASAGPDSARIEPYRGTVQVRRADAPTPVTVLAGGAAVIRPGLARVDLELGVRLTREPRRTLAAGAIRDLAYAPDGREIWAVNARNLLRWTLDGGTAEHAHFPKKGPDGGAAALAAFSPDRSALAIVRGDKDDAVILHDLPAATRRSAVPVRMSDVRAITVGPRADWVAALQPRANSHRVAVWDGRTGAERFPALHLDAAANCLAAAPDGRALAVGVSDPGKGAHNKVIVFDPATGERRFALPIQRRGVTTLAFSPDSRHLAAGFNGQVQVWDLAGRELTRTISGFERGVVDLAFSPDGRRLAGATPDGRVWVWNVHSGRAVQVIEAGGRHVRALTFSPDGRSLVTAGNDGAVKVWDLVPEQPADADSDA